MLCARRSWDDADDVDDDYDYDNDGVAWNSSRYRAALSPQLLRRFSMPEGELCPFFLSACSLDGPQVSWEFVGFGWITHKFPGNF